MRFGAAGNIHIICFIKSPTAERSGESEKEKKNVSTFYIFHLKRGLGHRWVFFFFFHPRFSLHSALTWRGSNISNLPGINNGRAHVRGRRRRAHSLTSLTQEGERERKLENVFTRFLGGVLGEKKKILTNS